MVLMVKLWDLVGPLDEHKQATGPVEVEMNSVLAMEALRRDPKRYTHELPKNLSPGKGQDEKVAREEKLKAELAAESMPDPHFPKPPSDRPIGGRK